MIRALCVAAGVVLGVWLVEADVASALPPAREVFDSNVTRPRPQQVVQRSPAQILDSGINPLRQGTISHIGYLIAIGNFPDAKRRLELPKLEADVCRELTRHAVLCILQRAAQPGKSAAEKLSVLKDWRPLAQRFEPRVEPALLGMEAHLLGQDQEQVLETLGRLAEGQQWGQVTSLARDRLQEWQLPLTRALTIAALYRLGQRVQAMDDLEKALQTPLGDGGLNGLQSWQQINSEALPASLARTAASLVGLAELRAAGNVAAVDFKRLQKNLADVEAQTSAGDLGKRLRQDFAVKLFLLGQIDEARALLDGPAAPDHAAALLKELRNKLDGASLGTAARALPGDQGKGLPPGLGVLLSDEQKKRWLPPAEAAGKSAENGSPSLQQAALLEKPWRDRLAQDLEMEKAAAGKEVSQILANAKRLRAQIHSEIEADRQLLAALEVRLKRRLSGAEAGLAVQRRRHGSDEAVVLAALSKGEMHDRTIATSHCEQAHFIVIRHGNFQLAVQLYGEALAVDPNFHHALNDRAWLLATSPDDKIRNGKQAVEDALAACEKSAWNDPLSVDTLAAAYAEIGRFDEAQHWQIKAMFAPNFPAGAAQAAAAARLNDYYRKGKPYRWKTN